MSTCMQLHLPVYLHVKAFGCSTTSLRVNPLRQVFLLDLNLYTTSQQVPETLLSLPPTVLAFFVCARVWV